ncbi:hypothetical protein [Nocardioides sp. TF02-7]|uniref:hypothetical protein n=1 Tax=Nocardioides sp. TF02-7 TaxID=2917724 RepID=UPI0023D9875E|nr:hypothetical protein [Nocardioides sp. TF02-7]
MVYGAVGAAGFVLGMVAGGLLTTVSWRWVFFGPAVLGLLLPGGRLAPDPAGRAPRAEERRVRRRRSAHGHRRHGGGRVRRDRGRRGPRCG